MELSPIVQVALLQTATQIPFLIAIGIGLWLAISRRKRHPAVSLWAAIGLAALLIQIVVRVAISAYVAAMAASQPGFNAPGSLIVLWNVAAYVLFLTGVVALTCAAFSGRKA